MPAPATRESLIASPVAQEDAHAASAKLTSGAKSSLDDIPLGNELRELLHRIVEVIGSGGSVTVSPLPETMTTTMAADQLGISRTTLMKLIRDDAIPNFKVGSHTRLRRDDVLQLRKRRLAEQRQALQALIALEDELGIE